MPRGPVFYYTYRSRETGPRIRYHTLGEDSEEDQLVWGEHYGPETFIGMDRYDDERLRIFRVQHGWARNDLFMQKDRGAIIPIVEGVPAHFQHEYHDGRLYIRTDWDAPNYRVMVMEPESSHVDGWTQLIPESADLLEPIEFVGDRIYVTYLRDVAHRILVYDMEGNQTGEVGLPENVSACIHGTDDGKVLLTVDAYLMPGTTYELDPASGARTVDEPPAVEFDASRFEVTKLWYDSAGGRRAPIHVMHRADIELDGRHPTILNGYGGFNASIHPSFSTTHLAWVELGGVYAVATLRGGGEYGESWHVDGMLENKQNVFDDFIIAAETLIDEGFTRSERLAISGGSNGGLLVASVMTQRPDLVRAVLCTYPDLDIVRFYAFTETNNIPALLEYGDARIPEQFEAIRQYSPYQAVQDGMEYPAVMLTTGDLDTRVPPLQARRIVARLQAASSSGLPIILWDDPRGGHAAGGGRPISLRIEDTARELAFLAQQLGLVSPGL